MISDYEKICVQSTSQIELLMNSMQNATKEFELLCTNLSLAINKNESKIDWLKSLHAIKDRRASFTTPI